MKINGKPVVDAKRPLTVKITMADTKMGRTKSPAMCAAARALTRMPNCISARVHLGRVYIEKKKNWERYRNPDSLRSEIIAFDRGGKLVPGTHTLIPPYTSDTAKYRRELSAGTRKATPRRPSHTKSPRKVHVVSGVRKSMR